MFHPHPKIAAIDVGSNTLRLLIVEIIGAHSFVSLHEEQVITRLGEGLGRGKVTSPLLSEEAMTRSLAVLKHFGEKAREYGVREILAVGTRALREAPNGQAFAERVKREAGYPLRIIDGEHEARLALLGVFGAIPHLDKIFLIDIGGGSTELTLAQRKGSGVRGQGSGRTQPKVIWSHSTDLGVVRLLEQYLTHNPPLDNERLTLSSYIKTRIKALFPDPCSLFPDPCPLVGTAGTYTTLAALEQEMEIYNPAKINGYSLAVEQLISLENKLYALPLKERKILKGLEPGRADVILPGVTLARTINEVFGHQRVVVSDGGLREGIVWEWMQKAANRQ